ncbi:transposase [Undibacterium arcticum]
MKPSAWTCGPIERHRPNILTYFKHRITNAVAEGLNSKNCNRTKKTRLRVQKP